MGVAWEELRELRFILGWLLVLEKYDFGTKFFIPGLGMATCLDRGGAIVAHDAPDSRGYAYDRLDVWMGAGDDGLTQALTWGEAHR